MSIASRDATSKPTAVLGFSSGAIDSLGSLDTLRFMAGRLVPQWFTAAWRRDPVSVDVDWSSNSTGGETLVLPALSSWSRLIASVNVRVPIDICLIRDISIPQIALPRIDSILRFDLEATTPFRAPEVFTGWHELPGSPDNGKVKIRQIVVKRSMINPLLELIKRRNLRLNSISVLDNDGTALPVNLLDKSDRSRAWLVRATAAGAKLAFAVAAAAALIAVSLTIVNLNRDIERASAVATEASAELQSVLKRVNDAETLTSKVRLPRLHKADTVPVLEIWEELTSVLPASTWLSDVLIDESTVQIVGQSANASELIEALARSPIFVNGAFASPVTRDAQRGFERFQIRMQTRRAKP